MLGKPMICAGGVSTARDFASAIEAGYSGVQMGTRFIATSECSAHPDYKNAILKACEDDIVLTEKISGVPVSVIRTPYVERIGTRAGGLARWMLRGPRTKHWMRTIYALKSIWQLKHSSLDESGARDYWQAGKSVSTIDRIEPCEAIMQQLITGSS